MNVCQMVYNELTNWLNNKPQHGDVAYLIEPITDKRYIYVYRGPDDDPYSHLISDQFAADWFMKEVDKLKVEEPKMNKRCDNCKHWHYGGGTNISFCKHNDQTGIVVPKFTSCDKHEPKEEKPAPFDNLKFYIKDTTTGEVGIKYICEDCGKIMDRPDYWYIRLPIYHSGKPPKRPGYYFYCEECNNKKEGKV